MKFTIWHNPRCSKSRTTLKLLEENGVTPNIVLYLDTPPNKDELTDTIKLLGVSPRDIIRKGEAAFSDNGMSDMSMSDDKIVEIMVKNPILIERPIVITSEQAVVGRPPENVLKLL